MDITYISLQGEPIKFLLDGKEAIECRPKYKKEPCVPEDYFDMIENCKVCGKKF